MKEDFEDKKSKQVEITTRDIEQMRKDLLPFKQKMIGKRLASPFEQYLVSLKTLSISDLGQLICHDPEGHERLSKINAKLELREYYEQEKVFQQFPEERELFANKVSALRSKFTV